MPHYRDASFDSILLEDEQRHLFEEMVAAARNVPRERRQKFHAVAIANSYQSLLLHEGLPRDHPGAFPGDLETLARAGVLAHSIGAHGPEYDVTPLGYRYFELLQLAKGSPVQRVEKTTRSFLDTERFAKAYPLSHRKWLEAERLLWSPEAADKVTTIGHLCREALQEFVDALAVAAGQSAVADKAKTIARMKAVFAAKSVSGAVGAHLDALLVLVGTLNDLVQRQEHGATKEGQQLRWEDGRRLVFLTLVVLTECDHALVAQ